jgi:glutathione S-transferase
MAITQAIYEMEALLKNNNSGYLFGESFSMADAAALATLFRIRKLNMPIQSKIVSDYFNVRLASDEGLHQLLK